MYSSSHRRHSKVKGVPENLVKLTGKYLWQGLFFHKVLKESLAGVFFFFFNYAKFLRTPILQNTSRRLLLYISTGIARSPSNILNGEIYKNSINNMLQKSPSQIFAGDRDYTSDLLQWYGNCYRSVSKVYQSVSKTLFSDIHYSDLIIFYFNDNKVRIHQNYLILNTPSRSYLYIPFTLQWPNVFFLSIVRCLFIKTVYRS